MGGIEAAPLVLDVKALALFWTIFTAIFSAGAVWATVRFTIKSVSQTAQKLEVRVQTLEDRREMDREEYRVWRDEQTSELRNAIGHLENSISRRIEDQEKFMKQVMFRNDGTTNYLPRGECEQCRTACQNRLDSRLESIQRCIEGMDRKRESSKDEITKSYEKLMQLVSRLQGTVDEHNKRGGPDAAVRRP